MPWLSLSDSNWQSWNILFCSNTGQWSNQEWNQFNFFKALMQTLHYGEVENVAESSQLWQIISLWMLIQKFQNFAHSSHNSPKIKNIRKIFDKWGNNPKNLLGAFPQAKIGIKKTSRQNIFFKKKEPFLENNPKISLKNMNSQIFSLDFSNMDIWNIWTPIKWERKFQNPYW